MAGTHASPSRTCGRRSTTRPATRSTAATWRSLAAWCQSSNIRHQQAGLKLVTLDTDAIARKVCFCQAEQELLKVQEQHRTGTSDAGLYLALAAGTLPEMTARFSANPE